MVNVRLDETHVRKARKLRERGVILSELVRQAIDERFDRVDERFDRMDAWIDGVASRIDFLVERHET